MKRRAGRLLTWDLFDAEMPIVVAPNEPAAGLRAAIANPHVRTGTFASGGGAATWLAVPGPARPKEFLLTAGKSDTAMANRMRLVSRIVLAVELMDAVRTSADRLAADALPALRCASLAVSKQDKRVAFDVAAAP